MPPLLDGNESDDDSDDEDDTAQPVKAATTSNQINEPTVLRRICHGQGLAGAEETSIR